MGRNGKVRFSMFAKYGESVRYAGDEKGKREREILPSCASGPFLGPSRCTKTFAFCIVIFPLLPARLSISGFIF